MASSKVLEISTGPRWRVLIAHRRDMVRHALRTLIEAQDVAVVEVADGEAALSTLALMPYDLLVIELDLPQHDGVTVMKMHRMLLINQQSRALPPAVIFTLAPEVRGNAALEENLRGLGASALIDDDPRGEVAALVEMILRERAVQQSERSAAA